VVLVVVVLVPLTESRMLLGQRTLVVVAVAVRISLVAMRLVLLVVRVL
jgi:hypothetical protein